MSEPTLPPSKDDTDEGWGERPEERDEVDRRLREERPPHHDRD